MIEVINSHTNKPYTPDMADHVCKYYGWLKVNNLPMSKEKMGGVNSDVHDPEVSHLKHSLCIAEFAYSGTAMSHSFIDGLIREWDNVETLFNAWPMHTIKYSQTFIISDNNPYTTEYTVLIKKYSAVNHTPYIPKGAKLISHTIK